MILANIIESAFHPLIWLFLQVLLGVHSVIGGSWGWAIIGLTLIVRTLTFPLTRQQFKGMAKMRLHAPELKKIQARYKDDRQRQQEETMKYYKEAGVNPLGACLPLLLQFPVFISLVYMLRTDLKEHICTTAVKGIASLASINCKVVGETVTGKTALAAQKAADAVVSKHASFLFVHDITAKASGVVLIVLMVLYVGSQVFTSAMMSVGNDRNQRIMAIALPFVFVLFVIQFAAGLLVYWIATNLTMIPQQMYMLRKYGRPSAAAAAAAAAESGGGSGGAGVSGSKRNGKVPPDAAAKAVRKPANPPPSARQRQRRKRSGRRR
jgi:YidC/Oxa1 family membrane protein insertase